MWMSIYNVELCAAGAIDRADHAYSWPTPGGMIVHEVVKGAHLPLPLCTVSARICPSKGPPLTGRLWKWTETILAQACLNWLASACLNRLAENLIISSLP